MDPTAKPFVQISIDEVYTVVLDLEGRYDADRYDRYATFEQARDAALSCLELTLDAGDYDDETHRDELEAMLALLESVGSFEELHGHPEYTRFLARHQPAVRAVA